MSHRHRRIIRRWVSVHRDPLHRRYCMPIGEYLMFLAGNTHDRWAAIDRLGHLRRYRAWRAHARPRTRR